MRIIRVELKYCECCGGLLLRAAGADVIYCAACLRKLAEMPQLSRDSARQNNGNSDARSQGARSTPTKKESSTALDAVSPLAASEPLPADSDIHASGDEQYPAALPPPLPPRPVMVHQLQLFGLAGERGLA